MIFISSNFVNLIDQQIQYCFYWSILTYVHLMSRQHVVFLSHFSNLFNSDCFYDFFNNIKQNYWFSETWINIKILFYFVKNYCSDSAEMLEIVNQLSACLYENYDDFCKWFSHCFEKDIENFIYVKNAQLFLLVHDVQNIIFDYLWKWFYCLLIFKVFHVA